MSTRTWWGCCMRPCIWVQSYPVSPCHGACYLINGTLSLSTAPLVQETGREAPNSKQLTGSCSAWHRSDRQERSM